MDARIWIADDTGDELALLSEWLRGEDELRGRVKIVYGPVRDTELGSLPELLSVTFGAREAGTVLASSLISWIQTRRTTTKITVESVGYSVTLDSETVGETGPLLEQILQAGAEGAAAAATSRAVLIGVSQYTGLPVIPAARNSLQAMRDLLSDRGLGGWAPEQFTVIPDPASAASLAIQVADLAEATTGVFLLYYVGHGVLSARGELCLTVTSTRADRPKVSGLPWADVADVLRDCPARMRLVILDCSFAGRAVEEPAVGGGPGPVGSSHVEGVYTLAATAGHRTAHVPSPDQQELACTSFTGVLRDLIRVGIPGRPPCLTLSDLYPVLRARLLDKGLPVPYQRGIDTADLFSFTANAAISADPSGHVQAGGSSTAQAARPSPATARTDEPRARRILGDAIQAGQLIPDEMYRTRALTYVAIVLAATDPDRAERLAQSLSSVNEPQPSALAEVAEVLAAADPDRAERLARSITGEYARAQALAGVARGMASADPDRAERLARSITDESLQSWALDSVAPALAVSYPVRAERLAQSGSGRADVARVLAATDPIRAERLAQWATHESVRASVLAKVAQGIAAADPDRAERLARSITDEYAGPEALADVAGVLAVTDPVRAERLALSIDKEGLRESTLVCVVKAMAVTDPVRAERLARSITSEMQAFLLAVAAEAMTATEPEQAARLSADAEHVVQSMTDDPLKAVLLGFVAQILALADPDRAERLAADAERLAQSNTDEPSKAEVLEQVARSLALMHPDRAERLVHSITDPNERTLALANIADILIHGEDRQMAPSSSVVVLSLLTPDAGIGQDAAIAEGKLAIIGCPEARGRS
jgi:hypothetical protein